MKKNIDICTCIDGITRDGKICQCSKGKELKEKIKAGQTCPACQNTGIVDVSDEEQIDLCYCHHGWKIRRKLQAYEVDSIMTETYDPKLDHLLNHSVYYH